MKMFSKTTIKIYFNDFFEKTVMKSSLKLENSPLSLKTKKIITQTNTQVELILTMFKVFIKNRIKKRMMISNNNSFKVTVLSFSLNKDILSKSKF